MESANLHHLHHQLQDHELVGSSPLVTSSCYGVGSIHSWTSPNAILQNTSNFSPHSNGVMINSRDSRQQNDILVPSLNTASMIQDLGFQWVSGNNAHVKGADSYHRFTEMIQSSPPSIEDFQLQPTSYIKNEQQRDLNDLREKLLLRSFSSGCQINGLQVAPAAAAGLFSGGGQNSTSSLGNFSQILPTINISNLNQSCSGISSSLEMNMQALDLFSSGRFSGCLSQQASNDNLGLYKDCLSYGLDHTHQTSHRPSNSLSKTSPFSASGATEAKRPSSSLDQPKLPQSAQKKPRSSCPPFKVRKEKLGDRIAALQQLVAPFGKTDTASVLMEAIGYIKFLQNQVETLSVPYMKSLRSKASKPIRGGSGEGGHEEPKRDLRSRGLCLVPLSCLSYVTDGGGGVWPPPSFSSAT
ncbi:transcription factor bHLH110 [Diospyros lotus]|uniref:transcription factor bHLH110 n=1 Tax=Diospyros lotus TaxID=55363 RepID=UPI002258D44B|nr:transcription factor bHLH110 [Diospyros lotus]